MTARSLQCLACGEMFVGYRRRGRYATHCYRCRHSQRRHLDLLSPLCECGTPRRPGTECCDGCAALDGVGLGRAAQTLISELRVTGPATREVLELEIPYLHERSLYRATAELIARGRLRRTGILSQCESVVDGKRYRQTREDIAEFDLVHRRAGR
jgi:hypothetical protein